MLYCLLIIASFNWFLAFLITQFYGPVADLAGPASTFWGFGLILVAVLVLSILFVPETKGRSLDEIQEMFRGNAASDESRNLVGNEETAERVEGNVDC